MYLSVLTIETLVLSLVGTSTCCTTESQATRECYIFLTVQSLYSLYTYSLNSISL